MTRCLLVVALCLLGAAGYLRAVSRTESVPARESLYGDVERHAERLTTRGRVVWCRVTTLQCDAVSYHAGIGFDGPLHWFIAGEEE